MAISNYASGDRINDDLVVPVGVAIDSLYAFPPESRLVLEAVTSLKLQERFLVSNAAGLESKVLTKGCLVGVKDVDD